METETYTGLTAKTFNARYYGHNTTFNNREAKQTTLSRHCWSLKDNDIPLTRNWSINFSSCKALQSSNKSMQAMSKRCLSILFCTNLRLRQHHSTKRVKFLDGANKDISGLSQTLEEGKNLNFILVIFLLLTRCNYV